MHLVQYVIRVSQIYVTKTLFMSSDLVSDGPAHLLIFSDSQEKPVKGPHP